MPPRRETFNNDPPRRQTFDELDPVERPAYKYAYRKVYTRLDNDTLEFICSRLFAGSSLGAVGDSLCIPPGTLTYWKVYGEAYNDSPEDRNPEHEIYGRFVLGVRAALGDNKQDLTDQIHDKENKNWFRPFRILERKDPENYGMNPRGGREDDTEADEQFL